MADNNARGRFVWHELMTPNSAGAHEFYSKAIGWKSQPWEQDSSYSMFVAPSGPLGGAIESREGAPYWVPYIGVPDIEAAIEQTTSLGGAVKTEPTPLPNGGSYAVVADPHGGTFGIYSSSADPGQETEPKVGEFSWHELATTDNRGAFDFYSALFAWDKISEFDMGPMGVYMIFGRNGKQMGGIFNKGDMGKAGAAYWVAYVRVQDVHDTVKKVAAARGSLVTGPMEVPGGDWIAQFTDPHGALFAAHVLAVDVKPQMKAAPAKEAPAKAKSAAAKPATKKKPAKQRPAKQRPASKKPAKRKAAAKASKRPARKAAKAAPRKAAKKAGKKKRVAKKKGVKKSAGAKKAAKKRPAAKKKAASTGRKREAAKRR